MIILPPNFVGRSDDDGTLTWANGRVERITPMTATPTMPLRPPCRFLVDEQRTRADGEPDTIKCNCGCGGQASFQAVHLCGAAERQRPNGKPALCVPGMKQKWDADHQTEAAIYQPCQFCSFHEEKKL
jgi:hypothetical protein